MTQTTHTALRRTMRRGVDPMSIQPRPLLNQTRMEQTSAAAILKNAAKMIQRSGN